MTIDLIIQLIASLTGTGGLIALFLITEKKTAAQLQNTRKMDEKWQQIIAQKERDFALLSDKYEAATAKIERLYDDNSELRNSLDQVNTDCAVSRIMRCDCIGCTSRKPPFGTFDNQIQQSHEEWQDIPELYLFGV